MQSQLISYPKAQPSFQGAIGLHEVLKNILYRVDKETLVKIAHVNKQTFRAVFNVASQNFLLTSRWIERTKEIKRYQWVELIQKFPEVYLEFKRLAEAPQRKAIIEVLLDINFPQDFPLMCRRLAMALGLFKECNFESKIKNILVDKVYSFAVYLFNFLEGNTLNIKTNDVRSMIISCVVRVLEDDQIFGNEEVNKSSLAGFYRFADTIIKYLETYQFSGGGAYVEAMLIYSDLSRVDRLWRQYHAFDAKKLGCPLRLR